MTKKTRDQDIAFIQALADLLKSNELSEVEVMREYGEDDTLNVRVSQIKNVAPQAMAAPVKRKSCNNVGVFWEIVCIFPSF